MEIKNEEMTIEQRMKICNQDDEWFQKGCRDVIAQNLAIKEYFEILANEGETIEQFIKITPEEQLKRLKAVNLSLKNHEETVQQNRNLQTELNKANRKIEEMSKQPFFPYPMNDGRRTDFGEFYLISHAWFNITNFPLLLGIVEVEWKTSGIRKMYLGAGNTNGKDFKQDVLGVALHGQKIKDSTEDI